jgi:outer membrane autotransporter protein
MNSQSGAIIENPFAAASPMVTVTGTNSVWNVDTGLAVGNAFAGAPGYLVISAGGVVNSTGPTNIGADLSLGLGPSIVTVTGTGSTLNAGSLLAVGYSCGCGDFAGTLTIADGARVSATAGTQIGILGVLNLGTGGFAGTIDTPTITNNGRIVANFTDTATLAAAIDGSGTLNKLGSGKLILSGTSTYTGATTVDGGTLTVNGSIANSFVTINGGTLGGNGTVGGFAAAAGAIIAPGNSIGTLNVAGPATFNAGSIYQVEANAAGQADKIIATGAATINGGTVQVLAAVGNYGLATNYNILHATSVTGTFSSVTSSLAFLTASLAYTPTDVTLTLTRNASAFQSVAQTFNQRAVGGALDASPFGGALVQAVLPLTVPQALQAFDQLSGEVHPSTMGALVDESLYVRSAILGRLRQASYGGDAGMAALSMGGPQAFAGDEELSSALAYAKSPMVTKAPRVAPAPGRDIVFWSQGFGAWGKFNSDGNAAALSRDLAGFITGFDARFGNWRGGIAAGYTGSHNNTDGRGSANVETGHVAAYGGVNVGALNLRAGGAYAFHTIDTDRTINFPGFFDRATAHYQGGTGQIFGEAGYGFAFGKLAIEPFAGAAWVRLDTDAFSEKGGAAALNVAANSFEVGYSTLGVRAASLVPLDNGMGVIPRASAAWQHAFNSVTPDATVAFQNVAGSFVVAGVPIARDALLAEAGLDLAISRNATIGVSYTGQIANNVQDHAAKGRFSWKFN